MLRLIGEIRPAFVLAENVRGAVNLALDTVRTGLEAEGYEVRAVVVLAAAFGAPHRRERLFVIGVREDVANTYAERLQGRECTELPECTRELTAGQSGALWPTLRGGEKGVGLCGGVGHWEMLKRSVGEETAHRMRAGGGGQLNPDWVECLMGIPTGWTDIDCENNPLPWPGWPALAPLHLWSTQQQMMLRK